MALEAFKLVLVLVLVLVLGVNASAALDSASLWYGG